jgi:hypothetical protein
MTPRNEYTQTIEGDVVGVDLETSRHFLIIQDRRFPIAATALSKRLTDTYYALPDTGIFDAGDTVDFYNETYPDDTISVDFSNHPLTYGMTEEQYLHAINQRVQLVKGGIELLHQRKQRETAQSTQPKQSIQSSPNDTQREALPAQVL